MNRQPSPALAAMHEHDLALGIDPLSPSEVRQPGARRGVEPVLVIPPPPWSPAYSGEPGEEVEP